jgi:hypothetical protein
VCSQLLDVAIRVKVVRPYATEAAIVMLEDNNLISIVRDFFFSFF